MLDASQVMLLTVLVGITATASALDDIEPTLRFNFTQRHPREPTHSTDLHANASGIFQTPPIDPSRPMASIHTTVEVYPGQEPYDAARIFCRAIALLASPGDAREFSCQSPGFFHDVSKHLQLQLPAEAVLDATTVVLRVPARLPVRATASEMAIDPAEPQAFAKVYQWCQEVNCNSEEFQDLTERLQASAAAHPARVFRQAAVLAGGHSDKLYFHGYERFYAEVLQHLRFSPIRLLEIGYKKGASAKMWQGYFRRFEKLVFIDINIQQACQPCACLELPLSKCAVYYKDQSQDSDLQQLMRLEEHRKFDIVVDDGSHEPLHQMVSFEALFPHVVPGGVYIIEDTEKSYHRKAGLSVVAIFQQAVLHIDRLFHNRASRSARPRFPSHEIESVTFGQNCIIVKKVSHRTLQFNQMPYRFWKHVEGYQSHVEGIQSHLDAPLRKQPAQHQGPEPLVLLSGGDVEPSVLASNGQVAHPYVLRQHLHTQGYVVLKQALSWETTQALLSNVLRVAGQNFRAYRVLEQASE